MLKNYLLITIRNMMKNKLFIFINIFGLAISIACCIVAYFNYDYNKTFDYNHANATSIYRVSSIRVFQNEAKRFGYVPMGLGAAVKQNITDIDQLTRYSPGGMDIRRDTDVFYENVAFVDPEFFSMFSYEFIEGSGLITDKSQMCISDELALKYFGQEKALGKTLTQLMDSGKRKEYVVAGVFKKQPKNSSFYIQAYTNFQNQFGNDPDYHENSWKYRATLFIQINNPSRFSSVAQQIQPYTENNNTIREDFIIREFDVEPFKGMAVRDSYDEVQGTWTNSGSPIAAVIGTAMMGIFVLLIACFNLTNTAVAVSSRRLKEIGIRKVMGSSRKHLIVQFMGETMFICFISLFLGIAIAEFLLIPAFNAMWSEMEINPDYFGRPDFLIAMSLILFFTGLLAGSYPALYISKFQPTSILKGKLKFGGTNFFTRFLLTLQFMICVIGIVCSLAFVDNAKYQQEYDLGFNKKEVAFTFINNKAEYETFRNRLLENPDVISISGSQHHIGSNFLIDPIKHKDQEIEVDIMDVGDDYVKTVGLTILEGRDFTKDSETDKKESVIVSQSLVSKFGWDNPIGKEIVWMDTARFYVIGVAKDIYNRGLWREVEPVMIRYRGDTNINYIIASAPLAKMNDLKASMETIYKDLFPDRVANIRFMDDEIVEANEVNNNILRMFVFLGIVALFLSATGLFTLVSLNIIKKMKEIGVRKVMGASAANIIRIINTEFLIILLIASVLGGYAGGWMAGMLMDSIWDYFQHTTISTMIFSALIMFAVSILSIGYKIYNTIHLNPAHVLRDE